MTFLSLEWSCKPVYKELKKTTFPYLKNTEEEIGLRPPSRTNDNLSTTQIKIVK